jgi:hypothetical protein
VPFVFHATAINSLKRAHGGIGYRDHAPQGDTNDAQKSIWESNNVTPSKTAFHLHGDKAYILDQYTLPT